MLTNLLTRPCGTRETQRATGDGLKLSALVSGTHLPDRDQRDARRFAHNPEVACSNPAPATTWTQGRGLIAGRRSALFDHLLAVR
jgi:hypothetical protein